MQTNRSSFNQARDFANVKNNCFINTAIHARRFIFSRLLCCPALFATGIEITLFYLTCFTLVIFTTAFDFTFSAMRLPASKRTAQVVATGIGWIGKEINLTVPASGQTLAKVGLFLPQYRSNNSIIVYDQPSDFAFSVPVGYEVKKSLNLNYKKAKFSLMSLMYFGMPSLSFI